MEVLISGASAADPREFRPTSVYSPERSVVHGSSFLTHLSESLPFDSCQYRIFDADPETLTAKDVD
jgi:hypothetical protein